MTPGTARQLATEPPRSERIASFTAALYASNPGQAMARTRKNIYNLNPVEVRVPSLLDRTELSVAQIAERFGFSSQFHFSKAFKQAYGMAPTAYRKAFRSGRATRPAGLMFRHHPMRRYFYEGKPGKIQE